MKGLPSFDFDVQQGWIDLSQADELDDEDEERRNWEWFQVSHVGHASPRKTIKKTQHSTTKQRSHKGNEEDSIKQMLKEHNEKVKQSRSSNAEHRLSNGKHHITTKKISFDEKHTRKTSTEERKSSLECVWHAIPIDSVSRKPNKYNGNHLNENSPNQSTNSLVSTRQRSSPDTSTSLSSHQSVDTSVPSRPTKTPHEDLQEMLYELKAKQTTHTMTRIVSHDTKQPQIKRKLVNEEAELQLLVEQHNDKHKRRLSSLESIL